MSVLRLGLQGTSQRVEWSGPHSTGPPVGVSPPTSPLPVINLFCFVLRQGLAVVVQDDLKFATLLHAPECLDYRPVQAHLIDK